MADLKIPATNGQRQTLVKETYTAIRNGKFSANFLGGKIKRRIKEDKKNGTTDTKVDKKMKVLRKWVAALKKHHGVE